MLRTTVARFALAPQVSHLQDKLLINGAFVKAASGKTFPVTNPATEEVVANVAEADATDVDIAVKAARTAFHKFRLFEGAGRRELMTKLANLVHKHSEELAAIESLDNGKPYLHALHIDVAFAEQVFRYYAGWADKVSGELAPTSGNTLTFVKRQPVGVCGQIIPWNFPLLMAAWKLAPALALGNTVVLKPAEQTPLSALRLGELAVEAGFPEGTVNILPGFGPTAGVAITGHMDVDKVAFTGSTVVGREVMRAAAYSNLKKVSLELGGKSPLIICADADMDGVMDICCKGIFLNSGQVCTASSRIYVHESIYDAFVEKFVQTAKMLKVGPGNDLSTTMGPLISAEQYKRVMEYIRVGKAEGATVVTGGESMGDKGYFIQPTIFTNVTNDMRICREEIFGPVSCVMKFSTMEEAVQRANDTSYGLAAGICTTNLDTALRYSAYINAGTVWVNTWNMMDTAMPFGGFKESGIGREMGKQALDLYTETKSVMIKLNGHVIKP